MPICQEFHCYQTRAWPCLPCVCSHQTKLCWSAGLQVSARIPNNNPPRTRPRSDWRVASLLSASEAPSRQRIIFNIIAHRENKDFSFSFFYTRAPPSEYSSYLSLMSSDGKSRNWKNIPGRKLKTIFDKPNKRNFSPPIS